MPTWIKLAFAILVIISICGAAALLYREKGEEVPQGGDVAATASQLRESKERWKKQIIAEGPKVAYEQFKATVGTESASPHEQAHAFGEALYDVEGLTGLQYCDSSFEFGCYHSFFGVAVAALGIGVLPQFDEACTRAFGDMNLPCQHGIGHGVLVYTDYENLVPALELCETISDLPTGGCSSGVFMEYNFHTMDEQSGGYLRPKSEDLFEPCNTLPQRFQASCYFEQVQWWQSIFDNDFAYIGTLCNQLPMNSDLFAACNHGIGNYLGASVDLNIEKIITQCKMLPSLEGRAQCHEGASWLVSGIGNGRSEAMLLCDALPSPFSEACEQKL